MILVYEFDHQVGDVTEGATSFDAHSELLFYTMSLEATGAHVNDVAISRNIYLMMDSPLITLDHVRWLR